MGPRQPAGNHSKSQAEPKTVGPEVELTDVVALCALARFCDRAGGVWDNTRGIQ